VEEGTRFTVSRKGGKEGGEMTVCYEKRLQEAVKLLVDLLPVKCSVQLL
jgi:hypothetical protein